MSEQQHNSPRTEDDVVEMIRAVDVTAPPELHARVQELAQRRSGTRSAGRRRLGLAAGVAAAAVLVLALVLAGTQGNGGNGSGALTLGNASQSALRAATLPAPAESSNNRAQLTASVDGIPFPYWGERFGWRAAGARVDHLGGRSVGTVFYVDGQGRRVGYAIVSGRPAPAVSAGAEHWVGGTAYRVANIDGATIVTWKRDGRLCIVAARGVAPSTLLALASWHESGSAA